jgi:hypothetical protein
MPSCFHRDAIGRACVSGSTHARAIYPARMRPFGWSARWVRVGTPERAEQLVGAGWGGGRLGRRGGGCRLWYERGSDGCAEPNRLGSTES